MTSSLSSPTSFISSCSQGGKEVLDGRVYHYREDVAYVMPEDDEDKDRLHQQHWMLRLVFGGNFDAPVEKELQKGVTVLDLLAKYIRIDNAAKIGGPAMNRLWVIFSNFIRVRQMVPEIGVELPDLLKNLGFKDIRSRTVGIAALDGTKLGELVWEDVVSVFDAIRPLLTKLYPDEFGTEEQFTRHIETVRQETQSKIDPQPGLWYSMCAR